MKYNLGFKLRNEEKQTEKKSAGNNKTFERQKLAILQIINRFTYSDQIHKKRKQMKNILNVQSNNNNASCMFIANQWVFYRYFHGKGLDEFNSLVPPVLTFTSRTRHATYSVSNYFHSLRISLIRRRLHLDIFFRGTTMLNTFSS